MRLQKCYEGKFPLIMNESFYYWDLLTVAFFAIKKHRNNFRIYSPYFHANVKQIWYKAM